MNKASRSGVDVYVRKRRWLAVLLLGAYVASACGSTPEERGFSRSPELNSSTSMADHADSENLVSPPASADLPVELPPSPLLAYLDSATGGDAASELHAYAEELAVCMRGAGFDFMEYVPHQNPLTEGEVSLDEGSVEWISIYGFGISTLTFEQRQLGGGLVGHPGIPELPVENTDPNLSYYETLSSADQKAFDRAMEGDGTDGCRMQAQQVSDERFTLRQAFFGQFQSETQGIEEQVEADRRVVDFTENLNRCVRGKGYEFGDMESVFSSFVPRVDQLVLKLPDDPVSRFDEFELEAMSDEERQALFDQNLTEPPPLPAEFYPELAAIQEEEVDLAVAVHECGSLRTLNNLRHVVRVEFEEEFLAKNEKLLIAFIEASQE